jgi:hypothetical protein
MQQTAVHIANHANLADMLVSLTRAEGTSGHGYVTSDELRGGRYATRNHADAAHYLCLLHGRHPGVVDFAATHTVHSAARDWLLQAVDGFARERTYLTQLVVAAGPLPSTPGQAESEAATHAQHHALEMLAQSDRVGCAFGAAAALVMDWKAVRTMLDRAADRFGIDVPAFTLPSEDETLEVAVAISDSAGVERAIGFGAQQLFGQHRGLWDLLEARQIARGDWH